MGGEYADKEKQRATWRRANVKYAPKRRNLELYNRYHITTDQYHEILEQQNGCCALCGKHFLELTGRIKRLCIDHDHKCCSTSAKSCGKCIRGLICLRCNAMLGWIEHTGVSLGKIKEYMESVMPLVEFKCKACKDSFESYVPNAKNLPATRPCPVCGHDAPRVEVSRPAKRNPALGIQR